MQVGGSSSSISSCRLPADVQLCPTFHNITAFLNVARASRCSSPRQTSRWCDQSQLQGRRGAQQRLVMVRKYLNCAITGRYRVLQLTWAMTAAIVLHNCADKRSDVCCCSNMQVELDRDGFMWATFI